MCLREPVAHHAERDGFPQLRLLNTIFIVGVDIAHGRMVTSQVMRLSRIFPGAAGSIVTLLLLILPICFIIGHVGGSARRLDWVNHMVSEYASTAPNWEWIAGAMVTFGLVCLMLAFRFVVSFDTKPSQVIGSLLIALVGLGMIFVAYAPTRRVPQAEWKVEYPRWDPRRWIGKQPPEAHEKHGAEEAYATMHYAAIIASLVTLLAGMSSIAVGLASRHGWRGLATTTIILAIAMAFLFWRGHTVEGQHGLWQRLGFVVTYGWFWVANLSLPSAKNSSGP